MDEGGFVIDYRTPPGTSLAETNQELLQAETILKATPGSRCSCSSASSASSAVSFFLPL